MLIPNSLSIPPFAGLSDAVVAQAPRGRFAFLMTMFRDVDDRPYLKARAKRVQQGADFSVKGAEPFALR